MNDNAIMAHFQPLYGDLVPEDAFHIKKPLLAHYTTIQTLEKILASNEIWFSNPLFMNDLDEVRFGVFWGNTLVMQSEEIVAACQTQERATLFRQWFAHCFGQFDTLHLLDTYVFCMSEHEKDDNDGIGRSRQELKSSSITPRTILAATTGASVASSPCKVPSRREKRRNGIAKRKSLVRNARSKRAANGTQRGTKNNEAAHNRNWL